MFYLDNEAAREVLLDSATPIESGGWLVRTFTVHEMQGQLRVWVQEYLLAAMWQTSPSGSM